MTNKIPLTKGQKAIVDSNLYPHFAKFKWFAHWNGASFYAARWSRDENGSLFMLFMHRAVLGAKRTDGPVDHINGNSLDNRKANLRFATHSQNIANQGIRSNNTSGFKGVWWCSQTKLWRAAIQARGKREHIGLFKTPEEASAQYAIRAKELHGEFSRTRW